MEEYHHSLPLPRQEYLPHLLGDCHSAIHLLVEQSLMGELNSVGVLRELVDQKLCVADVDSNHSQRDLSQLDAACTLSIVIVVTRVLQFLYLPHLLLPHHHHHHLLRDLLLHLYLHRLI